MEQTILLRPAESDDEAVALRLAAGPAGEQQVTLDGQTHSVSARMLHGAPQTAAGALALTIDGRTSLVHVARSGNRTWVHLEGAVWVLERVAPAAARSRRAAPGAATGRLVAPMPGRLLDLLCAAGDTVEAGQTLVLLEAMKMELRLAAPASGQILALHAAAGAIVERGTLLLEIGPATSQTLPASAAA
jgi:biotin carboxyl carrier protein